MIVESQKKDGGSNCVALTYKRNNQVKIELFNNKKDCEYMQDATVDIDELLFALTQLKKEWIK